jgi:predicted CXXCH cytochrome family protein
LFCCKNCHCHYPFNKGEQCEGCHSVEQDKASVLLVNATNNTSLGAK